MDLRRTFISLNFPAEIRVALQNLQKRDIYTMRWLPPKNFHITLNFLGNLNERDIEDVNTIMTNVAKTHEPFKLILNRFKKERDMLWLLPQQNEPLLKLQDELKERLEELRLVKRERRSYVPHILFAKTKSGRSMNWLPENFQPLEFVVESLNLMESKLTPGTATHILIESFDLTN